MNLSSFSLIGILLTAGIFSCKKQSDDTTASPSTTSSLPHTISCPAQWMKDSVLQFHSNVSSDSTFFWEFGDGTNSTDSTPVHVFTALGTYTVTLTINSDSATTCSTVVNIVNTPSIASIGGTHTWHDTSFQQIPVIPAIVTPHADTVFPLYVIDPLHLQVLGQPLTYSPLYSTDSMLQFRNDTAYVAVNYYPYLGKTRVYQTTYMIPHSEGYITRQWTTP